MPQPTRLLAALAILALTVPASASGLVQLSLAGEIVETGGGQVRIEVEARVRGEVRRALLDAHLAEHTRANDVAALFAARARHAGLAVVAPDDGAARSTFPQLFIEDVTAVRLRLGHGLWSTVTLCEDAPQALRVLPPKLVQEGAELIVGASTFHPHDHSRGRSVVEVEIDRFDSAAAIAEELFSLSTREGWVSDRPSPEVWRAVRMGNGARIQGVSVQLLAPGADWGLEVELPAPAR